MTNPHRDLLPQIEWIGANGFDFVDLAVEPPRAETGTIDPVAVGEALARHGLEVIVHTSPFLPFASAHGVVREAAAEEAARMMDLAVALQSPLLTVHYVGSPGFFPRKQTVGTYASLLRRLAERGGGARVAIENSPKNRGEPSLFREIFDQAPEAGLLLDVGHTHLNTPRNLAGEFLDDPVVGPRLVHVHLSDNDGADDLHAPLGAVRNGIDWPKAIRRLQRHGYDGTVTLEVFSPDTAYLLFSRERLRRWWKKGQDPTP
jgi:sugar phosphate isomerase/epimerase